MHFGRTRGRHSPGLGRAPETGTARRRDDFTGSNMRITGVDCSPDGEERRIPAF